MSHNSKPETVDQASEPDASIPRLARGRSPTPAPPDAGRTSNVRIERRRGDRRRASLTERLAFERLLADLSARFANVSADRVHTEIERALKQLIDFLDFDRSSFGEFSADGGEAYVLCSAAVEGVQPMPRGRFPPQLVWYLGELRAGRTIVMASLPEDLPPEAVAEAEYCRQTGLRSNLAIPLRIGGRVIGAIAFAAFRSTRQWPEDLIARLKIVGEVFAQAVARSRAEHETRGLRSQLWHSDRVARIGALTGSIAHELNQPLMAILNNAQAGLRFLSGSDPDIEEIREILEDIVRDDKRAGAVIRGLRTMVRRQEPERSTIQLAATIGEVLELLYSEFLMHQVEVKKHFETACAVLADKTQIQQVMLNLVMNAIEAMRQLPANQRLLRLTVSRSDSQVVRVAVRDCGVGISGEKLAHAFDAFWSTKDKGMGLGLAVSRSIVEAHGGRIWAEANDDQGVTFFFEMPLVC